MKHPLGYIAAGCAVAVLLSLAAAACKHLPDNLTSVPVILLLLALLATQAIQLYLYARKLNNHNNHHH